jgi:long-subunit fatty acid transport protein
VHEEQAGIEIQKEETFSEDNLAPSQITVDDQPHAMGSSNTPQSDATFDIHAPLSQVSDESSSISTAESSRAKTINQLLKKTSFHLSLKLIDYSNMVDSNDIERIKERFSDNGLHGNVDSNASSYGFKVGVAYQFNPILGLEAGYSYLGGISLSSNLNDNINNYQYKADAAMSSSDIVTTAKIPLSQTILPGKDIYLLGMAGIHYWTRTTEVTFTTPIDETNSTTNSNGIGYLFGAALKYRQSSLLSYRIDWNYRTIEDEGASIFSLTTIWNADVSIPSSLRSYF